MVGPDLQSLDSKGLGADQGRWGIVFGVFMVRPERFERPTYWFVASCSIQLSYGRTLGRIQLYKDNGVCGLGQTPGGDFESGWERLRGPGLEGVDFKALRDVTWVTEHQ